MQRLSTNKRSFENGVQFAWDGTSLELAQTCLRKYAYSIVYGIKPKEESVHLLFGGLYASALELFYKLRAEGSSHEEALHKVVKETMINSWDHDEGCPKTFNDSAKTRPNLIRTIVWYIEEFGREHEGAMSTYHLQNGKPAVELSFALELTDNIIYCGHLDRVSLLGDEKYVMDQKTTGGALGSYFASQFSPNNQMSGYSWAGHMLLNSPIKGVIIDAAQIAVNFTRFERYITYRSKAQLEEWRNSTIFSISVARQVTASAESIEDFPMNLSACGNYGGCPFRLLCSRDPGVRANFIKSDYIEHNWDPLEER